MHLLRFYNFKNSKMLAGLTSFNHFPRIHLLNLKHLKTIFFFFSFFFLYFSFFFLLPFFFFLFTQFTRCYSPTLILLSQIPNLHFQAPTIISNHLPNCSERVGKCLSLGKDICGGEKWKANRQAQTWQTNDIHILGTIHIWPWWIPNALIISKI
jgi:hypothetical protein